MKVLGTFYTALSAQQLAEQICPPEAQIQCSAEHSYTLHGQGLKLVLEGAGDILIEGDFERPMAQLDTWLQQLQALPLSCAIDVHGDAARLLRRHMQ